MQILATNILSPLGTTTEENYQAVKAGKSGIKLHEAGARNVPFNYSASLFDTEQQSALLLDDFTAFESIVLRSARTAIAEAKIDFTAPRVAFILSTTKGNITTPLGDTAKKIATALGVTTEPIVVCNACISGVTAQILALRLLSLGLYDYAIVTGADVQSDFIIGGFLSLKALSPEACRPYDIERLGLNLGEAAATIIFSAKEKEAEAAWQLTAGAMNNDAFHISGPHPKGEGAYRALQQTIEGTDSDTLATISVHGTATMYNDQMESKAIERAGLSDVPLSALKGYYGHTMGAAGLLETIITMRALDDNIILPTKGFTEKGVSGKIFISKDTINTDKKRFVKMLSGFGGCNGAVLLDKANNATVPQQQPITLKTSHTVTLTPKSACIDGKELETVGTGKSLLTYIYKEKIGNYPKFYKMDMLARLAFIATELLKQSTAEGEFSDDTAVLLFNRSSSIVADREFQSTINDKENYFPSPATFVYTLPNITTGEIALRNNIHGETAFYVLSNHDEALINDIIRTAFCDNRTKHIIAGWVECTSEEQWEAELAMQNAWYAPTFG